MLSSDSNTPLVAAGVANAVSSRTCWVPGGAKERSEFVWGVGNEHGCGVREVDFACTGGAVGDKLLQGGVGRGGGRDVTSTKSSNTRVRSSS